MNFFSKRLLMISTSNGFEPIEFTDGGSITEWTVPKGVYQVRIELAGSFRSSSNQNAAAGRTTCVMQTVPNEVLYIRVANFAYNSSYISTSRDDMNTRIVVAGGGGLSSLPAARRGMASPGAGGGSVGGNGTAANQSMAVSASGGSQTAGGGYSTRSGTGASGSFGYGATRNGQVGHGGDGWFGGGYACTAFNNGGFFSTGGGGSSYADPNRCTDIVHEQGVYNSQTGYVKISPVD